MSLAEILSVIGDETFGRQVYFANQHAGIKFIDHAPHLCDHIMDFGLIGGMHSSVARLSSVKWPSIQPAVSM